MTTRTPWVTRHWPLVAALILLWALTAIICARSVAITDGRIAYGLDDAYIHMAIAKNFAAHGVWGVTRYEFSSSSSSLLWTSVLALVYRIFWVGDGAPLVLNLIIATTLLVAVSRLLRTLGLRSVALFAWLTAIVVLVPLVPLVFSGQEHALHALLTILFVYASARSLDERSARSGRLIWVLAPLLTLARYEGLFCVFVVCLLFLLKGRRLHAVLLGAVAIAPLALYGVVSHAQGWFYLPNSVLLKGNAPRFETLRGFVGYFYDGVRHTVGTYHVFFLVLTSVLLYIAPRRRLRDIWSTERLMIAIFVCTTLLHMQFARTGSGWFHRYEAYLVALGIFVIAPSLARRYADLRGMLASRRALAVWLASVSLLVAVAALLGRGIWGTYATTHAIEDIYYQQYQMGLFVREFYQGRTVALNDIGAVNYLADIHCLDLVGLGSIDVARVRKSGEYHYERDAVSRIARAHGTAIAIVYDHLFQPTPGGPAEWRKLATWSIVGNIAAGGDRVSFYATDPAESGALAEHLAAFAPRLPAAVSVGE